MAGKASNAAAYPVRVRQKVACDAEASMQATAKSTGISANGVKMEAPASLNSSTDSYVVAFSKCSTAIA